MNNINQVIEKTTGQKTFWSKLVYPVALFSLLNLANIHDIHAQSNEPTNSVNTELSVGKFISQLDKKLGVTLPAEYDSKVRNFVQNNFVMQNSNARVFTQNFITEEMKKNRGISKQNQLLFIRYSIYYNIEKKDLYDGTDGDENRLEEFEVALDLIENCGKQYINDLNIYVKQCTEETRQHTEEIRQHTEETRQRTEEIRQHTEETRQRTEETRQRTEETRQRTEETRQRIEETRQRTEEIRQRTEEIRQRTENTQKEIEEIKQRTGNTVNQIMSADSAGLRNLVDIYDLYKKDPDSMTAGEIQKAKELARYFISDCKRYGIDYKKLLSPEVRRFYGIE